MNSVIVFKSESGKSWSIPCTNFRNSPAIVSGFALAPPGPSNRTNSGGTAETATGRPTLQKLRHIARNSHHRNPLARFVPVIEPESLPNRCAVSPVARRKVARHQAASLPSEPSIALKSRPRKIGKRMVSKYPVETTITFADGPCDGSCSGASSVSTRREPDPINGRSLARAALRTPGIAATRGRNWSKKRRRLASSG